MLTYEVAALAFALKPYQCCTYTGRNAHAANAARSTVTEFASRETDSAEVLY